MGNKNLHQKDETIEYFICYLIYDSQVVSKIGVYELNVMIQLHWIRPILVKWNY